jgi:recombination protein RecA
MVSPVHIPGVVSAAELQRPAAAMVSCGIVSVDLLTGGIPRGALTEICGEASSGRSSLLLAVLAAATHRQELCALVDVADSFDPPSAGRAGVDLDRLLWVRCSNPRPQPTEIRYGQIGKAKFSAFPAPKRYWREIKASSNGLRVPDPKTQIRNEWFKRLEQALKAADLLLQGGGFGVVALDLADVPCAAARRVPLASWFRFRRAVEHTPTVLLLIEQTPNASTCASLVLKTSMSGERLETGQELSTGRMNGRTAAGGGSGNVALQNSRLLATHAQLLHGISVQVEVLRATAGSPGKEMEFPGHRKGPHSTGAIFESCSEWAG